MSKLHVLLVCCVCGCTNMVTIYSEPTGAKCFIDGAFRGETPLETPVTSWALKPSPTIRLEKEGCQPFEGILRKKFQVGYTVLDYWTLGIGCLFNSALVSGEYGFLLRDEGGSPVEVPPSWAGRDGVVIEGRQDVAAVKRKAVQKLVEQERATLRHERAVLKAQIASERARAVRLVVSLRDFLSMSGSGDVGHFYANDNSALSNGVGIPAGVRVRGRFGLMIGYDSFVDKSGSRLDEHIEFKERSLQAEAYFPLNSLGNHEMAVCARYAQARLFSIEGDDGWKDGSGFGVELAYCLRSSKVSSWRFGWRRDWIEFDEFVTAGSSSSVSDKAEVGCVYVGAEIRF